MIVGKIDIERMSAFKSERDPIISPNSDGIKACHISFKAVEPKTGQVHVVNGPGAVQNGQNVLHFDNVVSSNSLFLTMLKEPL
jgi:hypothetical protein